MKFEVVCFDIDGTLYPKWVTDLKLVRSFFPSPLLALRYRQFRKDVRKEDGEKTSPENREGFRLRQAQWMSDHCRQKGQGDHIKSMDERVEKQFYSSWRHAFSSIRPYPGVRTTFEFLQKKGVAIAVLSDFPIERKLHSLNVADLVDYAVCAEESGYLKPNPAPFNLVCSAMGVDPEAVLYVGDSCTKDMFGASRVGMHTALLDPKAKSTNRRRKTEKRCPYANIVFSDYREFKEHLTKLLR